MLILLLIYSMLIKKNFLMVLLNMEMISIIILIYIYLIAESKIFFLFFIFFMICEAVIGLTLCIKFVYTFNNVYTNHVNLMKFN